MSASFHTIKSVLLCVESISKINNKYEDCVLQTGLVGAIVDLLRVLWPSGAQTVLEQVATDRYLRVLEPLLFLDDFESGDLSVWSEAPTS